MSTSNSTQPQTTAMTPEERWLRCIEDWYPQRRSRTYFLPPFFFRKTQYDVVTVPGIPLPVLQPVPTHISKMTAGPPLYPLTQLTQPPLPVAGSVFTLPQGAPAPISPVSGMTAGPLLYPPTQLTQPPLPVAGSVFTLPQGAPAPLPRYQDSDFTDDEAAERVLACLRALSEEQAEAMVVISQLLFHKYLDGCVGNETPYCDSLPRLSSLESNFHDGDFNVLVVHRHYGLMVLELKAVGTHRANTFDLQRAVKSRVQKAIKQLDKAEEVLRHLLSDRPSTSGVRITKTVVLPNVTSTELLQAVGSDTQLEEDLCACLGTCDITSAIQRCLCKEKFPSSSQPSSGVSKPSQLNPANPAAHVSAPLRDWWQQMTSQSDGSDPVMTDTMYDFLLARFCGPATSVEVATVTAPHRAVKTGRRRRRDKLSAATKVLRTEGEAAAETGLILSTLALYPDQITLLSDPALRFLHLCGPPGTGKTVMLVVKAMQELHQGHNALILSSGDGSRLVSILIEHQLQYAIGANPPPGMGTVHLRDEKDFAKPEDMMALASAAGNLFLIVDEVDIDSFTRNSTLAEFIVLANSSLPGVSVWCSGYKSVHPLPGGMVERTLTVPLRLPPAVTRQVQKAMEDQHIPAYSALPAPAATDGPPVRWLRHSDGVQGHSKGHITECEECARNIVLLLAELGVGIDTGPDALHYRDVLIVADSVDVTPYEGMGRALSDGDVPVQTLDLTCKTSLRDVALARTDKVTLTRGRDVTGLERRVVVVLCEHGVDGGDEKDAVMRDDDSEEEMESDEGSDLTRGDHWITGT